MNPHFQLLWSSVFAPRAAVDLARQYPNPLKLGIIYLFVICIVAIAIEYLRPVLVQPLQLPEMGSEQAVSWLDAPLNAGLFSVAYYIVSFGFALWFWPKMAPSNVTSGTVQAVVAVSFASALALLLPVDLLWGLFENSGDLPLVAIGLLFFAITMVLSTLYFSHGLELSMVKSFWLNVLCISIVSVFFLAVMFGMFAYEDGIRGGVGGLQ